MGGDGFRIDDGGSDGTTMEIDNIVVRNTLRTHIFQKDVVKATNGYLYVSDSCVISSIPSADTLKMRDDKSAIFASFPVTMWCKEANATDGTITSVIFTIDSLDSSGGSGETAFHTYDVTYSAGASTDLQTGMTAVRISGGSLLLDASSTGAPYMDVIDDAGGIRVRVGQVKQEADYDKYGILGLDGSGNRVFEISEQRNEIAGWTIDQNYLGKDALRMEASSSKFIAGNSGVDTGTTNIRAVFGKFDGTNYGMRVWDGSDTYVKLSSDGNNEIAGWTIDPTYLGKNNLRLDATNTKIIAGNSGLDTGTGTTRVIMGLFDSGYGIRIWDGTNTYVRLHEDGANTIAGWSINPTTLEKVDSTGGVRIDAANKRMDFLSTATALRLRIGQVDTDKYGIRGEDGSGTRLFEISEVRNELAGWTISSTAITGGVVTINKTGYIGLTAGSYGATGIFIDGVSTARQSWVGTHGKMLWTGTQLQVYGNAGNTKVFETTNTGATIGGWDLTATTISGGATTIHNTGYIGLTATDYNNTTGIFIDGTTGNNRQSWVGTHGKMVWTGTQLQIYGNAGSTKVFETTDSGAMIGGWNVSDTAIWSGTGPDTTDYTAAAGDMTISSTGAIHAYKFRIEAGGNAYFKGDITGASGTFSGKITAGTVAIGNDVSSTHDGIYMDSNDYWLSNGTFSMGDGAVTWANSTLTVTGTINATLGSIGGFTIGTDLTYGSKTAYNSENTGIFIGDTGIGLGLESTGFYVSAAGVLKATGADITGDIVCDTLTANTDGEIAGWEIDSEKISKNNVSIIQSTAKTGMDITDGTDSILTVAATSAGMTDVDDLVGVAGGSPSDEWLDHRFEVGTTGDVLSSTYWTQETSTWPNSGGDWRYNTALAEINDDCASFEAGDTIANANFGTEYHSSFYRDFTTHTQTYTTLAAGIKAHGWKYYGDSAKLSSFVEMQLSGSSDGGTSWVALARKTVDYTAAKFTKVDHRFKPSAYNKVRVRFNASVTANAGKKAKEIVVGGFAVDGFYMNNINASAGSGGIPARKKPFVELTQEGLLVFSSKDEYMRLNDEGFTLKGPITATSIDVEGTATVTGPLIAQDAMVISGSLLIEDSIPIGFGTEAPEAKVHVKDYFNSATSANNQPFPPSFTIGEEESFWRVPDNVEDYNEPIVLNSSAMKHAAAIKAEFVPFINYSPDTGEYGRSAAFMTTPIHDSYGRTSNHILYGELQTSAEKGHVYNKSNQGHTFEMSGSVSVGHVKSYNTAKEMAGIQIYLRYGPSNTNIGTSRQQGVMVQHGHPDDTIDNITTHNSWVHHGFRYVKQGIYTADPDAATGAADGGDAGVYLVNVATGTHGPSGGYGLYIKGSEWKSYIQNDLGINDATPSFMLDVDGEIRATDNITAYSDVRDKTNITQITGSLDMVKAIRGVRFDWKDAYKKKRVHTTSAKSGRLDKRHIGVVAQEVEKVLPELISEDKDGRKNMSYANLTAVLVEAVKEQSEQIEGLKERIKKLENE